MKSLKLIIACLLVANTYLAAQGVQYIGVDANYHAFQNNLYMPDQLNAPTVTTAIGISIGFGGKGGKQHAVIFLGDTVRFNNVYPVFNLPPNQRYHTITSDSIPEGAMPFDFNWDNNTDTIIDYVPTKIGSYKVYCIPHSSMYTYFAVFPQNALQGIDYCTRGGRNGIPCNYGRFCTSCVGLVVNCSCVAINLATTLGCSNGLIAGRFCTGTTNGTTFAGFVQNCACQSVSGNNTTSVCSNGLAFGGTCLGVSVQNTTFVGSVQNCVCTSTSGSNTLCGNGLFNGSTCSGTDANNFTFTGTAKNCECTKTLALPQNKVKVDDESEKLLYPNPANEYIYVPLRQSIKYNVYVYDAKGNELLNHRAEYLDKLYIDIRSLPKGNYVVKTKYCACSAPKESCQGANKTYKFIKE